MIPYFSLSLFFPQLFTLFLVFACSIFSILGMETSWILQYFLGQTVQHPYHEACDLRDLGWTGKDVKKMIIKLLRHWLPQQNG